MTRSLSNKGIRHESTAAAESKAGGQDRTQVKSDFSYMTTDPSRPLRPPSGAVRRKDSGLHARPHPDHTPARHNDAP